MSNELQHYGVKGMKWGVRRYQNKDGSLTDIGKRRAQNDRSESRLVSMSDGYILKRGTKVQRISTDTEDNTRSYTYVSFSKHDNEFYDKKFTENLETKDPTKTIYKNTFITNSDLKIPSKDINKRIFTELYEEQTKEMIEAMSTARRLADISAYPLTYQFRSRSEKYKGDYKRAYDDAVKYYMDRYSNMTIKQLQNDAYYDFMNAIANNGNKKLREAYFDKVKAEGYSAIIDDNDSKDGIGGRGYTDEEVPTYSMIILNASKVLNRSGSSVVKQGKYYGED